ncbi:MAG TPA: hypothetical protein ENK91_12505 [Bacteroidetes bacterium]|nr:hypothetical protein [Bacteroidota bacterium]
MEEWEIDFNWLKVQHFVKDSLNVEELPSMETILFMIGLQDLGIITTKFTKEQKVGITSLGTCVVLSQYGYFERKGIDETGWPVWIELKPFNPKNDIEEQKTIKQAIIKYFEENYDI